MNTLHNSSAESYLQFLGEYKEFQINNNSFGKLGQIVNNDIWFEPVINRLDVLPFSEHLHQRTHCMQY